MRENCDGGTTAEDLLKRIDEERVETFAFLRDLRALRELILGVLVCFFLLSFPLFFLSCVRGFLWGFGFYDNNICYLLKSNHF